MHMFLNRPPPKKWWGSIISIKLVDWADKSLVVQNKVEMNLISHNSTSDISGLFQGWSRKLAQICEAKFD